MTMRQYADKILTMRPGRARTNLAALWQYYRVNGKRPDKAFETKWSQLTKEAKNG